MCQVVDTSFACDPQAVGAARAWVRDQLATLYPDLDPGIGDDIGLALSELVTNCVRADAHHITVSLTLHRGELVVATTDDAPGTPHRVNPSPASPHGRGLQIVDALTTEWGVTPSDEGKTVWGKFPVTTSSSFECTH